MQSQSPSAPGGGVTVSKKIIFRSARVFDGLAERLLEGKDVVVAVSIVEAVSDPQPSLDTAAEVVANAGSPSLWSNQPSPDWDTPVAGLPPSRNHAKRPFLW